MYIKEKEIDKLYKRIMKQDITAIDEIESLDQAKELIKMMASQTSMILKTSVYDFNYEKYIDDILKDDFLEDNALELDKDIIIPKVIDKYMFIKKGGKAIHQLGDISRDVYDAELIYVHGETDTDWIGSYCEGFGFVNVKFAKEDCRDATDEEIHLCKQGLMETIKF